MENNIIKDINNMRRILPDDQEKYSIPLIIRKDMMSKTEPIKPP